MPWRCSRGSRTLHTGMEPRVSQRKRWGTHRSNAPPGRWLWQIPHRPHGIISHWKRCPNAVFHVPQLSDLHAFLGCCPTLHVFLGCSRNVSQVSRTTTS